MAPPSAVLEHGTFDVVGGVKPFTSGASDIGIPQSLMLACFIAFMVYNIALIFDINIPAIINFGTRIYQTLIHWAVSTRQHIRNAQAFGLRRTLLAIPNFGIQIYSSSCGWLASTYRSGMIAHAFHAGLEHMISNPREHLGRTVFVDAITVPGAGSLALIRGLPSDVFAPELRKFLESTLFIQYVSQLKANPDCNMNGDAMSRNTNHTVHRTVESAIDGSVSGDTDDAPIDTSTPGLWNGTCVRSAEDAADTRSTSGINMPTSEASASDISAVDDTSLVFASGSWELDDIAPASSLQYRSHSRRS